MSDLAMTDDEIGTTTSHDAARAVLKELEWSHWAGPLMGVVKAACPVCRGLKRDGHKPACSLAAALASEPPAQPKDNQAVRAALLEEAARDVEGMARNGRSLPSELAASIRSLINVRARTPSAQPEAQAGSIDPLSNRKDGDPYPENPLSIRGHDSREDMTPPGSDTSGPGDDIVLRALSAFQDCDPDPTNSSMREAMRVALEAVWPTARLAAADAMAEALGHLTPYADDSTWKAASCALSVYRAACATDQRPDAEAGTREGGENA